MHKYFLQPAEVNAEEIFGIAFIEEKIEENAKGRSDKGKIQTLSKYAGVKPGSLSIKVMMKKLQII